MLCMALGQVLPGEQRSHFLAVGLDDNTVRIISLAPTVCIEFARICMEFVLNLYRICIEFERICIEFVLNLYRICIEHVYYLYRICIEFV